MRNRVNKNILKIQPYVAGKPIEEVKREFGLRSVVKLASNESPYPPSPKVLKAMNDAAKNVNRYPAGDCYLLRKELAKRLKIKPEQFVFGVGSDEVIILAIRAFVNPGDEVVLAKPSFLMYSIASRIAGAKLREVPLKGLSYDLVAMKKAITKRTKIVFIGNPDNPSGLYVTKKELATFLKGLRKDVLVFMDEAYFEFVDEKDYPDTLALLKKQKNVLVARTFSKIYGLAGLRIGYGMGSVEVIDYMNRIREPFNVNSIAQVAAVAALNDQTYYKKIAKEMRFERCRMVQSLENMGLCVSAGCTNFIQVQVPLSSHFVFQELLKTGVIVRDMSVWGLKGYIRVSIGLPKENTRFLKALKQVLSSK